MKRIPLTTLTVIAALLVAGAAGGAVGATEEEDRVLFEDQFEDGLAEGWSWVRENPEEWRVREGGLEMRAQPGRIWGGPNDAENILLRRPTGAEDHAIAAEVTVTDDSARQYEQAGLLWYFNDDRFVKLIKEHVDGEWWVVMGCDHDGMGHVAAKVPLDMQMVRLRIEISGEKVTGLWRPIGDDPDGDSQDAGEPAPWKEAATCDLPREGEGKIGLFTQDGPKDTVRWARFTDFRILRPAE